MACRGVFFAIDEKIVQTLKKQSRADIVEYVQEEIEEVYFEKFRNQTAETDKAWDAMHRAFAESELEFNPAKGIYPGNIIVMGGEVLYGDKDGEEDYIITLKTPAQVKDIYDFLSRLSEAEFRDLYFKIDKDAYGPEFFGDLDCQYTWDWLSGTLEFWKNAAEKGLSVIFTVDQ